MIGEENHDDFEVFSVGVGGGAMFAVCFELWMFCKES